MELLDIYDKNGNWIGIEDRNIVHQKGMWHKTVHCWLYDKNGYVFFQRRKDRGKLYTTASGHLSAKESIEEGFHREILEEIGIFLDTKDAELVEIVPFKMDRKKEDGSIFKDRAFANVYIDLYEGNYKDFKLDTDEVSELVLVPVKETLELFKKEAGFVKGYVIHADNSMTKKDISFTEFLVNEGETALQKYGKVLEKIVEKDLK